MSASSDSGGIASPKEFFPALDRLQNFVIALDAANELAGLRVLDVFELESRLSLPPLLRDSRPGVIRGQDRGRVLGKKEIELVQVIHAETKVGIRLVQVFGSIGE